MILEIDAFTNEENDDVLTTPVNARTSVRVDCDSIKVSIERRIQRGHESNSREIFTFNSLG